MSRVHQALSKHTPEIDRLNDSDSDQAAVNGNNIGGGLEISSRVGHANTFELRPPDEDGRGCLYELSAPVREQLLKLVRQVFLFQNSAAPRIVVFSSVEDGGSAEVCFRAAELLTTQVSASVCVLSLQLPKTLGDATGADRWYGLSDAMVNAGPIKDFVVPTSCRNLWFMPPGSIGVKAQQLFPPDRLRKRVLELRQEFDYILVDAPLVLSSPNAVLLGQMADGVILVLEANSTRRESARIVKETLEGARVNLLGAVLNNQTSPIPETLLRKL